MTTQLTASTSTTNTLDIRGTWTALITPFDDGQLDETALRDLVEFQIAEGISGLVACGSTGETPTLSDEEYRRVATIVIDQSAGRVPVMVGTGTNDTRETLARTRLARELGAAAALVVMPPYNRPTQRGLEAHIRHIADGTGLPLVLYNVPGRTGCDLLPATVGRLARIPTVIGIKEASGDINRVGEIVRTTDPSFVVLTGDDAMTLPSIALGAHGVVSVVSNIIPAAMSELTDAARRDDFQTAREIHLEILDLCDAMFCETNPVPVKAAAELLGLTGGEVRLPLVPLEPASGQRVFAALLACRYTTTRVLLGEESTFLAGEPATVAAA